MKFSEKDDENRNDSGEKGEHSTPMKSAFGEGGSREAMKSFRKKTRGEPGEVPDWAQKAGNLVQRTPFWVKLWVPVILLLIIAGVVALQVIAAGHTPEAALGRYIDAIEKGRFKEAWEMVSPQSGKFGTEEYFVQWQSLQAEKLGRLRSYNIRKYDGETRFFGRLVQPDISYGTAYTVTLFYQKGSHDVVIHVVDDGGSWPMNSYKFKLAEDSTRLVVSPVGSTISIDGVEVGVAEENQALIEALSLDELPNDLSEFVDYARTIIEAIKNQVIDIKGLFRQLDRVAQQASNVVNRVDSRDPSWSSVLDALELVAEDGKALGTDIIRIIRNIYWIFGGGDDGSIAAKHTRTESGLVLENLPSGWHLLEVSTAGTVTQSLEFYAPTTAMVTLEPDRQTREALKNTVGTYIDAAANAFSTLSAERLGEFAGGEVLDAGLLKVRDLASSGRREEGAMIDIDFKRYTLLAPTVATVRTEEVWNVIGYTWDRVSSQEIGIRRKVTYTLVFDEGRWTVVEAKVSK